MPRTATAVFQEPLGQRRVEHPVPAAADQSGKKTRASSDCRHPVNRRVGDTCGACQQPVGRKR